jgi:hypothetical protein
VQRFLHLWTIQVIVLGVEFTNELIELEGGLPDFAKQAASGAASDDTTTAVDGGIVPLVLGATAVKLAGADFQSVLNWLDLLYFVLNVLHFTLERCLEIADAFSEAFRQFRDLFGAEQQYEDQADDQ